MKRCPKHYWFEYDETQGGCQLCEREAMKAGIAPPPPPVAPMSEPAAGDAWQHEGAPGPWSTEEWSAPATQPTEQPSEPVGAIDQSRPAAEAWPPSPSPQEPAAPPPILEPIDDEDTRILAQLDQLKQNGVFTILLIGFFAGGKTWFLNRVKHELGKSGYNVSPRPPRNRDHVRGTVNAEIHYARRLRDDQVESFAIVDIPGERLRDLVDKNFRAVRSVLAAMDMCGALIVALPADEVLLSEDVSAEAQRLGGVHEVLVARTKDNEALQAQALRARELVLEAGAVEDALGQLAAKSVEVERLRGLGEEKSEEDRQKLVRLAEELAALELLGRTQRLADADADLAEFTHDLCFMTGLMSKLKGAGSLRDPAFNFGSIEPAMVDLHISSRDYVRFSRPTFVAMTKADLVSHPDPLLDALISHSRDPEVRYTFSDDPLDTLRVMRPGLSAMFREWLQNVKFDFVTAFHEHNPTDTRIDYGAQHYGIGAVFDWITRAMEWDKRTSRDKAAEARARRLREKRDGKSSIDRDFGFMAKRAAQR